MQHSVYAIIPARSGSKGLIGKNVRLLAGHPLLAWSIAAARLAKNIDRVIVSTDSREYVEIAQRYGAEAPFLRPAILAVDKAQDIGFVMHVLLWLAEHEGRVPEFLVHLRPTSPLRNPALIDKAITMLQEHPDATSLCSAHEVAHPPCKYFTLNDDGTFSGLMGEKYLSLPRQQCPKAYQGNGHVDVLRSLQVLESGNLYGEKRLAFLAPSCGDIDTLAELQAAELQISSTSPLLRELQRLQNHHRNYD